MANLCFNVFCLCRALEAKVDARQYSSESGNEVNERFRDFSNARAVIQEELIAVSGNSEQIQIKASVCFGRKN
jgi:hypothetical protein